MVALTKLDLTEGIIDITGKEITETKRRASFILGDKVCGEENLDN